MDSRSTSLDRTDAVATRVAGRRTAPTGGKLALRLVIMAVLLLIVFGGLYAYEQFRASKIAEFFAGNKPPPVPIVAVAAEAQPLPQAFTAIGSIVAVHQVTVSPEVGGRVTKIFFEPGAAVRAGDPLIQINDEPEQGDLLSYRAQARLAQANLARASQLAARDYGPRANVDTYQSQLDQANAGIAKTQALIAQKLIRAPFAGVLGIRQVDLGQYLNPGAAVVTLTDLDTLYANFTLPEQNRAALSVGQTIAVTVDAYRERSFPAALTTIEPQVGADTRTIKLQATLANPDHLLMPGMFANARVVLPPLPDVVTVPETAVEYTLYGDSVFVVTEDGGAAAAGGKPGLRVKRAFVKTGDRFDNKVAILSGLKPGDRIASSGQIKLTDGAAVTLSDSPVLAAPAQVPMN
jgi:multidrug efflux system membrane fusion protein